MSTENNRDLDLLQAARCEDLKYDEIKDLTVLSNYEREIVDKLKMPGAHLLQGARGVGKSQLLRQAEIELDQNFANGKKLSVYINFKTSPLLEGVSINDKSAFQVWVGAKILQSVHQKLEFLNLINSQDTEDPYQKIFNIGGKNITQEYLSEKIHQIQNYALSSDKASESNRIGIDFIDKVNDINFIRETIVTLVDKLRIDRIIFLFDEVAHTFIPAQQEIFFEIFKLLHGNAIAVKAAVYPTVTSYGKNFEIGHDAILISLDRFETGAGLTQMRELFRSLFNKRTEENSATRKKIYSKGELLDQCIYMSSGNPRAFLHILLRAIDKGYNVYGVNSAIQEYVDDELIPYHNQVAKRLPRFANHVSNGLDLTRNYLIKEIRSKNEKEKKSGYQSAFFTIDRDISPNFKISLDLLCYSGILTKKGTVKIANKRTGQRYMVHLALMITEKSFTTNNILDAVNALSLTDYREFSSSDSNIVEYSQKIKEGGDLCGKCGDEVALDAKFCSHCGAPIERTSLISKLLDDSITQISISHGIAQRVKEYYPKVGDLLQATKAELMEIDYIGPIRSRIIKNAVEEYISG
ncbi:MAG TPA: zinc ribbon domain-containing protein [Cytophagales bacterium]|nr:zinc ribbon domain-containing protein [Cytophagales bacterium]HRG07975.1 zinc ribbon domain-containing protein [Cyclobacteriaceae bacterium]